MTKSLLQHKILSLQVTKGHLPSAEAWVYVPQGPTYISHFCTESSMGCMNVEPWGRGVISRRICCCDTMSAPCLSLLLGCSICQPQAGTGLPPGRDLAARGAKCAVKYGPVRYCGRQRHGGLKARTERGHLPSSAPAALGHKHCRHLRVQSLPTTANR